MRTRSLSVRGCVMGKRLSCIRFLIAAVAITTLVTDGLAAQRDHAACSSRNAERMIAGCTRVIADRSESRANRAKAYFNRGKAYHDLGQYDLAIADYTRAIELSPRNPDNYLNRAIVYSLKHEFDRAIADHNQTLRFAPNSVHYRVARGTAYQGRWIVLGNAEDLERAKSDYEAALRLSPGRDGATAREIAREYLDRILADEAKREAEEEQRNAAEAEARRIAERNLRAAKEAEAKRRQEEQERAAAIAPGPRRIALVIGNANYNHAPRLDNPANDARAVAAALRRLGFAEVIERHDIGLQQLRSDLKHFGDEAAVADWAVVYFAGHGIQIRRTSYLIPTNAKLLRENHIDDEAVSLPYVLSKVEDARHLGLVILDACRNNPFLARLQQVGGTRSLGRGLAPIEPRRGVLVAYAARDGQLAEDGRGEHSPFTKALLAHLEEPNTEIELLFRKVRDAVLEDTANIQEPFVYGSLPSERLYFKATN